MPTIFQCQCVRSNCLPPLWKVNPHFHHTVYLTLEITLAGWHFVFMEKCVTCTHCHVTRKQGHCIKIYLPFPSPLPLEKSLPVHCTDLPCLEGHLHRIMAEADLGYFFHLCRISLMCFGSLHIKFHSKQWCFILSIYFSLSNQFLKDVLVASYLPIYE